MKKIKIMMIALMMYSTLLSFGQDTLRYSDISTENKPRGSYLYYLSKDGSVYSVGDNVFGPGKVMKKMEYDQFTSIPQAEINLGIHKFKKQHITGNHLMIAGLITTTLGSVLLNTSYSNKDLYGKQDNPNVYKTIIGLGSGLLVAGFIVNIDSFRHLK
jgi:hypothetical protein